MNNCNFSQSFAAQLLGMIIPFLFYGAFLLLRACFRESKRLREK